jgi:hypothetical protein
MSSERGCFEAMGIHLSQSQTGKNNFLTAGGRLPWDPNSA